MAWLTGYTYRKKGAVNATTAGAQTNYQLKLIVGESSGASGEDVDCESHCHDFPNDIRFTKGDGETKHDYWIESGSLEGTSPNRKVIVWIEVTSIPASGSVDFYIYYRNNEATQYEDFTTFTEVDVAGDRIQKTINHIDHRAERDETTYLYKNYGINYFDYFEHEIKVKAVSGDTDGFSAVWMLANDVGGIKALSDSGKTEVFLDFLKHATSLEIRLEESYSGSYYVDSNTTGFSLDDWVYAKIVKNGTSLTCYLYSDSDYSTLVDTLSLTLHADHSFKYLYGCNTYNDGNNWYINADIENFNIGVKSGSDGDDTFNFFDDFEGVIKFDAISAGSLWSGSGATDWLGRPVLLDNNGTWIVIYRQASTHGYDAASVFHIRFSTDKGSTWSDADKFTDSSSVTGFPFGGHSTNDVGDAIIMKAPNGDLLIQVGERDSTFDEDGTYQYKSTNNGSSWSDEGRISTNEDLYGGNDYVIVGSTIYVTITVYSASKHTALYKSTNNGTSWTFVSNITTSGTNETGIEYLGNNTLLTVLTDDSDTVTYQRKSTDLGATWGSLVDVSGQLSRMERPRMHIFTDEPNMIYLFGRDCGTPEDTVIYYSNDDGDTWEQKFHPDSTSYTDCGYCDLLKKDSTTLYMLSYAGTNDDADIMEYIFEQELDQIVDTNIWNIAGTVVVSNGIISLDADDWITGKTAFGNGYCYESLSKADEQDIVFIGAYETHSVGNDDNIMLGNSDTTYPNDFDRFALYLYKGASVDKHTIDTWTDFRNTYYHYRIKKISNSKVVFEQEANTETYTNTSYIPTVNLKPVCRVWDSSQASTLDVDWALVRKSVFPEPTWGSWGTAEVETKTDSDTGSGAGAMAALDAVIPSEGLLDPMDATTGWQAQSGMTNITVNTTTKKEGTGALNLIKSANDDTDAYIEKTISSTNLTSKYVKVWLYLKDTVTVNKISRAQIYLYDASNNYRAWNETNLTTGWNLIIADTESTPDHQSGTPGNLAAITTIELDVDTNQATDTYAEGDVIADYYHYNGFDISDSGSGTESGIVSKQFTEADTGSGVEALDARSFCSGDAGIGEESFPPVFGTHFNIVVADGISTKEETIPAGSRYGNMHLSDIFLKVPALSTTNKTAKLELLTERNNIIFSSGNLDASTAKSYSFHNFRALKGITKYRITTDENVTDAKTFEIEIRGLRDPYSLTTVGLASNDAGSGVDTLEDLFKILSKTGSDTGSGVDISSLKDFNVHDNGSAIDASSFSYRDCIRADTGSAIDALGSRELALNDTGAGIDVGERRYPPAESRGFYYAKIGSTIFRSLNKHSFRITEELNKIPSFEFEISNSAGNRAAITAGITDILRIYHRHDGSDTLMFTGIINGDAIEYLSLERIRLVGYASYIDLNWRFHQHLNAEDAEDVGKCFIYSGSYSDKTTAANNDTINDVTITFSSINDAFYIGQGEQFFGMQVKYSTKGVQATNTTVVWEYSEGSSVWSTLDVLDETRQFTQDTGTYYITIPHKPSDWAKETVNSVKKFWIRARLTAGSYSTQPKLDRIKMMNIDPYRVYYFNTAANTIMDEVLDGTGYSMDVTDACPSDTISIVAEYETKLRMIAGVANALTWDDSGDKKAYQWWVDTAKKVHFKQKRGSALGDITKELTILNNVQDYFNLSNRLHFLGNYDGLNQLRAVIENTDSQDTHEIRELAVPEERFNNYIPLKEAAQKAMTYTKAPLQKIAATVTTKYWIDEGFEVGDTVTLKHARWNVDETAFQIVRADIGPRVTNLDMGISQEHLDGLKAGLQRQLDISGIRMHGSTSLLQFGPETMNYQRVDATTVYYSKLKFEIPSDARYIHKVLISWKLGNYRADVTGGEESEGHDHTGFGGAGGAHAHGGFAGAGGAHDSSVLDGGLHTPTELSKAHQHDLSGTLTISYAENIRWFPVATAQSESGVYGGSHSHTNPSTGYEGGHIHSVGSTGGPSSTQQVAYQWTPGTNCTSGNCVVSISGIYVASSGHTHSNPNTGVGGGHDHSIGNTGNTTPSSMYISLIEHNTVTGISPYVLQETSDTEDPAHAHTINEVPNHPHTAVAIAAHANHVIGTQIAHGDHSIVTQAAAMIDIALGIVEIAGGTTMMLTVNGEEVTTVDGDGTDIVITSYCNSGSNSVELAPIVGSNVKGGATLEARGIIFIESSKF